MPHRAQYCYYRPTESENCIRRLRNTKVPLDLVSGRAAGPQGFKLGSICHCHATYPPEISREEASYTPD
ncbi:hypothetical protein Hypma_012910 [Hypsizygus marmoreus]|uniref:Uncharacterized protein n=1 Tax=Hypsizygus marmoreus TaxID=39966 RepID=A0A369JDK3_HYPMA|nr:hypothetical protein Hypma_012910 [Hypsizygus marmoreus]